jgi:hypothetical protein
VSDLESPIDATVANGEASRLVADIERSIKLFNLFFENVEHDGLEEQREELGNRLVRLGRSLLPPPVVFTPTLSHHSVERRLAVARDCRLKRLRERELQYGDEIDALPDWQVSELVEEIGLADSFRSLGRRRCWPMIRALLCDAYHKDQNR